MSIQSLFCEKQYYKLLNEHLLGILSQSKRIPKLGESDKVNDLLCVIKSCVFCGAYAELLELLEELKKWCLIQKRSPSVDYLEYEFIALLYYLFNPDDYKVFLGLPELKSQDTLALEKKLENIIIKIIKEHKKTETEIDERIQKRIQVFNDYKNGLLPFYTVEYLYPYKPPFGEGTLDLTGCGNYVSLAIKKVPREKDVFTSFLFKIYGYTNGDNFWQGHS